MTMFAMTWDGTTITEHVINYERTKNICTAVGTLTFEVEAETGPNPEPWDEIILYENGNKKGTYYVSNNEKGAPTATRKIQCQDGSKRIADYFIPDIYNINYMTYARYWIEKFLTEAGVDYIFNTTSQGALLSENFSLGPSTAFDIITTLLQNSGWYMFFDADNLCTIGELNVDLTGTVSAVIDLTTITTMKLDTNDSMLRNRAVVWGMYDPDSHVWVYADLYQPTPWDRNANDIRTVLLSNSGVRNNSSAYALAAKLLAEFDSLNYEKSLEVAGEVDLELGDIVKLDTKYHTGECLVTTIGSRCSGAGLITNIILDQRCPRLFGYTTYLSYVYTGTDGAGVWRKPLDSNAWESFSTGLTHDGVDNYNVTDLIIKNGVFACVANGVAYVNIDRIVNWKFFDPVYLMDQDNYTFPTGSFQAMAVDIDAYTNNILIGYKLLDSAAAILGEQRSWVLEITPKMEVVSRRQVFIIDADHQDFKLIDVDKYAANRLCTAEAPSSYAPDDPGFWGTRKVRLFYDPEPKSVILGPPPECKTYDDPLIPVDQYIGGYYEDSSCIIEGNAISGFWSSSWLTYFTYDYFIGATRYNILHPIEWPITYGTAYAPTPYLFGRIVYRKSFEALTEATKVEDRMYHVCDMVKTAGQIYLYHHQITPLIVGNAYQIENVDAATTENITLYDEQIIDGVLAVAGTRVLVKDQTDPIENGIYYVHADANWTRSISTNLDETCQNGMFITVDLGTTNRWTAWQVETDTWNTFGSSDIVFVRVLELLAGSAMSVGGEAEFSAQIPGPFYYTTLDRYPRMREGIIYYLYDGHINVNDNPGNPFSGSGTHYFYIVRYDILNKVIAKDLAYQYNYTTNFGSYVTTQPSIHFYSPTQLIPSGEGVAFACFLFTLYPKWLSRCDLLLFSCAWPKEIMSITSEELWVAPNLPPGGGCAGETDLTTISYNNISWTGTTMPGENPSITSFGKFKALFLSEVLYICCLGGGKDAFEQTETLVNGNINFKTQTVLKNETKRGWIISNCHKVTYDNLDYVELNHDYSLIFPLYIRDISPYYIYNYWGIYDATNMNAKDGLVDYLNHTGLISPQQDDFDNGIYVYSHGDKKIYKESLDGITLATLNLDLYAWPEATVFSRFLYSNSYFFFIHISYKEQTDGHYILKLKNEVLFQGKYLCYLLEENKVTGVTRGLDYQIRDYDFFDLQLENSQEFPLVSWTVGSGLISYSGCVSGVYSFSNHLKYYSIELNPTTLAGEFNDTRIFRISSYFVTEAGVLTSPGKYIGVADRNEQTFSMISSTSITSADFMTLVTFSGVSGKFETSNSTYPYLFASTSGSTFYQRNPGASLFVEYPPVYPQDTTVIRLDDRV
jgi:hypothetical protein